MAPAVIDHFKQILGQLHINLFDPEIIQDQEIRFAEVAEKLIVGTVSPANRQIIKKTGGPIAPDSHPKHAGSMTKCRQYEGFSHACGSGHNQVVSLPNPVACGKGINVSLPEVPFCSIVDVGESSCRIAEVGTLYEALQPGFAPAVSLGGYDLGEPFIKRKLLAGRKLTLPLILVTHSAETQL